MLDRYAELYPKIAGELAHALPADWSKAWIQVEMDARNGSVIVYYVSHSQPSPPAWITPPLRLYERFRQMNNAARSAGGGAVWTTATFVVERGGAFDVDFGYEPIDIEDEQDRLDAWKARYLPS